MSAWLLLLLACVFKTFRKESKSSLESDLAHYLSTPDYSWDAMLTFTIITSDIEKYQFIETSLS